MSRTITYEQAVANVSRNMDLVKGYDAFQGSFALAVIFQIPKEQAIDDIIAYRSK